MEVVKAQKLDELTNQINECIREGAKRFLQMGFNLKLIRDGNLWHHSGAQTFREWAEREVHLKKSQVYNAMDSYEKYQHIIKDNPELQGIEQTRMVKLLPFTNGDERTEELLLMAATVDAKGFDNNLRELKGKIADDDCKCPEEFQDDYTKCQLCGKFHRIIDVTPEAPPDAQNDATVKYTVHG
jgi:hypothetical protein